MSDGYWRPRTPSRVVCGYTFRGKTCTERGAHRCEPRADRVVTFCARVLVHTKGMWAGKAFLLEDWQEHEIVRPLFGEVVWDPELRVYRRRYSLAYIVVARKNGKSELAAAIVLYLLVGDDEPAAEVFGAAADTKQAGKVGDVVEAMRLRSPKLNGDAANAPGGKPGRLKRNVQQRRIYDVKTASYFEVITSDALAELGANPHGWYIDEVLSQKDGSLFATLRTSEGTRHQMLGLMITTETNDPAGFGATAIDEAERVQEDPRRAPHIFAYCRKHPRTKAELERIRTQFKAHPDLPVSLDPFDEANWYWPNPALRSFKRISTMRTQALEARNEPAKEADFRQYQLNQRQQSVTRWMSLLLWDDAGAGRAWPTIDEAKLARARCIGGLDLSATSDITALAWLFPRRFTGAPVDQVVWRFWVVEDRIGFLSEHTGGMFAQWVREGRVVASEGDWIDYDVVRETLEEDLATFRCAGLGYDPWNAAETVQWLQARGVDARPVRPTYEGLSAAMNELMRRTKAHLLDHGGNPVARWMIDSTEVRHLTDQPDVIRPVKPERDKAGKRIDGVCALADAIAFELALPAATAAPASVQPPPAAVGGNVFRPSGRLKI